MSEPTIGLIVIYKLSEPNAAVINQQRANVANNADHHRDAALGFQLHRGNQVQSGDEFPMIITKIWAPGSINGKVMLDGTDEFWATSVHQDSGSGTKERPELGVWRWPSRD